MNKMKLSANILFFVTMFFWFSLYTYTPYINPELERMGVAAVFMGFVSGVYGFTQLLLRVPLGIAADRLQKQKFFICCGSLISLLSALCMLVFYTPVSFLIGRALSGCAASAWVSFTVLYCSYHPPEHSARAVAMLNASNNIGRIACFVAAWYIAPRFSARATFLVSAAGALVAFVLSLFITEQKIDRAPMRLIEVVDIARNRNLIITSVLAILSQFIVFATLLTFVNNLAEGIGADRGQLGLLNILLIAPSIVSNLLAGKWLLRYIAPKWLVLAGFVIMAGYCLTLAQVTTMPQLYALQAVAGIGTSLTLPLLMGMCTRDIEAHKKTTAMGFFQAIYGVGMTLGPICMGLITDRAGLRNGFVWIGLMAAASTVLAAFLLLQVNEKGRAASADL